MLFPSLTASLLPAWLWIKLLGVLRVHVYPLTAAQDDTLTSRSCSAPEHRLWHCGSNQHHKERISWQGAQACAWNAPSPHHPGLELALPLAARDVCLHEQMHRHAC